jgi:hypothetical protein
VGYNEEQDPWGGEDPFIPDNSAAQEDAFNDAIRQATKPKVRQAFNKYSRPGEKHGGIVTEFTLFHATDPDTGKKANWDDGNPVMKAKIVVQTSENAGPDEDGNPDDGRRAIYIKWYGDDRRAFAEAVGDNQFQKGAFFGAQFLREEAPKNKAHNGRKVWAYYYDPSGRPPNAAQAQPAPVAQPQPGPTTNATFQPQPVYTPAVPPGGYQTQPGTFENPAVNPAPAQPVPSAAAAPSAAAPVQVSPQQIQALIAQGFTDADIVQQTGASPDAVAFVRTMS